jgi:hypothetical protein
MADLQHTGIAPYLEAFVELIFGHCGTTLAAAFTSCVRTVGLAP